MTIQNYFCHVACQLDRYGDSMEAVGVSGYDTVLFDHDGDGVRTGTGWVKGDDGLLVLDRNGNGAIDNGSELFGADTVKATERRRRADWMRSPIWTAIRKALAGSAGILLCCLPLGRDNGASCAGEAANDGEFADSRAIGRG
ncbi:MAG: hypothetical protein LBD68_09390 [Zoogloeaceae bacterium]|nr:hypothetical protein [Zoogloeaceae bacterium]